MANTTNPPESYEALPFKTISISHVPEFSPTVTKVVVLKLNRPRQFNAVTAQMIDEIIAAYQYFDADDRVKAIVVTGSGPAFCAGADLRVGFSTLIDDLRKDPSKIESYRDGGGRVALAIHKCSKPTIMAINGPAAGFGITLTLPATIRVACASSKVSFAFSRRGLAMEACSSYFLPKLVGMSRALHLVTTGATYTAADPLLSNLFSEILPTPEETVASALRIAGEIAASTSTVSTRVMRDLMYRAPGSAEEAHLLESKVFLGMLMSRDSAEGMKSFVQKRDPEFKGIMPRDAPVGWPWWAAVDVASKAKL
ncbi:ClpP/crotonase-like domain-containing protein [Aspergillus pseudotamarii]|uniref:ClpP/crotonase-like domain-containing protein n=1 Tax=Aspergillus pseudotamarii TaxID=132259 RepID=A0A5N6SQF7_ASPPS|nr:ClpP/crotonase-like domain-containing protein [Aspergillus pseudotamarii]KAE8136000.1 ClpP/crotonase-like domain-containing protein [Aspergillus pseudotamarii]